MNPKVDAFLNKTVKWQPELLLLRTILLDSFLTEDFKWRQPCYTFNGANVIILYNFKDFCGISFLKGALLKDDHNLLIKPGEDSQAARYMKFSNSEEIFKLTPIIKSYIYDAIEVEKSGKKIDFKANKKLEFPEELVLIFEKDTAFKKAFFALTPGRQRGYNLHFTGAKQSATKTSRIESYKHKIMQGKGKDDCTCGHSKRMPRCDGSHKNYPPYT